MLHSQTPPPLTQYMGDTERGAEGICRDERVVDEEGLEGVWEIFRLGGDC